MRKFWHLLLLAITGLTLMVLSPPLLSQAAVITAPVGKVQSPTAALSSAVTHKVTYQSKATNNTTLKFDHTASYQDDNGQHATATANVERSAEAADEPHPETPTKPISMTKTATWADPDDKSKINWSLVVTTNGHTLIKPTITDTLSANHTYILNSVAATAAQIPVPVTATVNGDQVIFKIGDTLTPDLTVTYQTQTKPGAITELYQNSTVYTDEAGNMATATANLLLTNDDSGGHGTTEPENPGTTEPENPGTTEPENPGTTEPENPGTTEPEKPGTTEPENPGTTEPEKPGTTEPEKPGTTEPEKPGTTESEKPGTTEPEKPGTTEPEKPGTTEPEKPEPTTPAKPNTTGPSHPETTKPGSTSSTRPQLTLPTTSSSSTPLHPNISSTQTTTTQSPYPAQPESATATNTLPTQTTPLAPTTTLHTTTPTAKSAAMLPQTSDQTNLSVRIIGLIGLLVGLCLGYLSWRPRKI